EPQLRDENAHNDKSVHGVLNPTYQAGLRRDAVQPDIEAERKKRDEIEAGKSYCSRRFGGATCDDKSAQDRKSGSAGMPRPISYAVFCLKKKKKKSTIKQPTRVSVVRRWVKPPGIYMTLSLKRLLKNRPTSLRLSAASPTPFFTALSPTTL